MKTLNRSVSRAMHATVSREPAARLVERLQCAEAMRDTLLGESRQLLDEVTSWKARAADAEARLATAETRIRRELFGLDDNDRPRRPRC